MARSFLVIVCAVIASVPALGQNPASQGDFNLPPRRQNAEVLRRQPGNASDRYIVVMRDSAAGRPGASSRARQVANALAATHGLRRVDRVLSRALNGFVARLSQEEAEALSRDPRVEYVEQDVEIQAETTQTVPSANSNWGLDRIDQQGLPVNGQYEYDTDGSGVKAYVVDSGIRASHVEFGGRVTLGPDFVSEDPGNLTPNTSLDCFGHGTQVAGVLGGATFGVAKNVTLVAVRVLDCSGHGTSTDLINAIDWITQDHAALPVPAVANLSVTTDPVPWSFTAIEDAIYNSIGSGVTWVLAAGNHGDAVANYSPPRMQAAITVGASYTYAGAYDLRASFSNTGPEVDLYAPGVGITSAWGADDVATSEGTGTSLAAPQVAGVVARFLQVYWWAPPGHVNNVVVFQNATAGAIWDPGPNTPNRLLYSGFLDQGGRPASFK
jgi:subtilisin family serine protease